MPFLSVTQGTSSHHPVDEVETPTVQVSSVRPLYTNPSSVGITSNPRVFPPSSDHSVSSSISNGTLTYDNSADCKSVTSKSPHYNGDKSETAYFQMLYIMYTGCTGSVHTQIENLCGNPNSTIQVRHIKPMRPQLALEVKRRFRYLKLADLIPRAPRTSQWTLGQCTDELKTAMYTLPLQEIAYLENEMKPFISKHINLLKQAEQDIKDAKIGISRHDRQKMRLWEALFIPRKSI
jgi:hypothetical protein